MKRSTGSVLVAEDMTNVISWAIARIGPLLLGMGAFSEIMI